LLARQDGRIEVAPSFALRTHRALADEAIQQRAHGVLMPGGIRLQCRDQFLGALRRMPPQQFHHLAFGFTDGGIDTLGHGGTCSRHL
jgi:hypothetical protein